MYKKKEVGKLGEDLATKYLENKGYKILERNFEARQGEIDIIALDLKKEELVFIEVKTRASLRYGNPVEAVNQTKQKHIIQTIKYYLYNRHLENYYIRVDVIEIYLYKHRYKVNHIKQII